MHPMISPSFLLKYLPACLGLVFLGLSAALGTHFTLKTLYGVPAPATAPVQETPSSTHATTPIWLSSGANAQVTDMVLLGVVAQGDSATQGLALLQAAGNERAKVYAVGQTLPNGAMLKSVSARSITLEIQGALKTLPMDLKTSPASAAMASTQPSFDRLATTPNPMGIPSPQAAANSDGASRLANRKRLRAAPNEAAPSQP